MCMAIDRAVGCVGVGNEEEVAGPAAEQGKRGFAGEKNKMSARRHSWIRNDWVNLSRCWKQRRCGGGIESKPLNREASG